jgi:putative acyl-CoA dehydrogenase
VLRALQREPATRDALRTEFESASGRHPAFDAWAVATAAETASILSAESDTAQARSRAWVERLALALQAAALLRGDSPMADAFCRSRLGGDRRVAYGTLSSAADIQVALARVGVQA